ncbi:MAG: OadG family transporter subunit [Syntrophobacteraceae bacterium]
MGSISTGFQLTIFGMGLVFLLLALMALLLKLLLRSDSATVEEAVEEGPPVRAPAEMDPDALAAILIAVTSFRAARRKEAAPVMRRHMPGTLPSRWVTVGRVMATTNWHPGRRDR